jgi:DNA-binding winged helix-turn-helix (wHTH) protein
MRDVDRPTRVVRFGVFELDLRTGELRKRGVKVALQEQPFQVLAMLIEHPGDLVTREQLRSRLWPDAVFVDFDHGLNKAVTKIRRALGDLAESPRYVETLERRGYRFIAVIEPITARLAPVDPRSGVLGILRVVWADRTIPLTDGANLIGRDPAALIWVDSSAVSRRHARIVVTDGGAMLEDLGSKNGTFLNDCRLESPTSLRDGDTIRIGPARLAFRSAPALDPTRTVVG